MTIATTRRDGYAVVALEGDVDRSNAAALRRALLETLSAGGDLVVDLGGVGRIDSAAIASLVEAEQAARRRRARMALVGVGPGALRMMALARLDRVFAMHGGIEDAVAAWRREAGAGR